jgi:hypothetical protein
LFWISQHLEEQNSLKLKSNKYEGFHISQIVGPKSLTLRLSFIGIRKRLKGCVTPPDRVIGNWAKAEKNEGAGESVADTRVGL